MNSLQLSWGVRRAKDDPSCFSQPARLYGETRMPSQRSQSCANRSPSGSCRLHAPAVMSALALAVSSSLAQAQGDTARVSLPYTREYSLHSSANGQDYRLAVAIPPGYVGGAGDTTRFRVLYVLDGNDAFPLAVEAHRLRRMQGVRGFPDMIIVGIGYPVNSYAETMALRNGDYTPSKRTAPDSCGGLGRLPQGGGPAFVRVLREEIIPFIDARYRTTPDRGIIGHSLGGLFAFYALFEAPDLFQRYGALSPALHWDREMLFSIEARHARAGLDAKLFVGVGSLEIPCILGPTERMLDSLRAHKYAGLSLQSQVFPDEFHMSVIPAAMGRALQALGYDPPSPTPSRP